MIKLESDHDVFIALISLTIIVSIIIVVCGGIYGFTQLAQTMFSLLGGEA